MEMAVHVVSELKFYWKIQELKHMMQICSVKLLLLHQCCAFCVTILVLQKFAVNLVLHL